MHYYYRIKVLKGKGNFMEQDMEHDYISKTWSTSWCGGMHLWSNIIWGTFGIFVGQF